MKKKLLRLCSIVLVISMVLGNLVSLAADDTTSTGTEKGMDFSTTLKGVIENPFDSNIKTVEATICLPTGNLGVENNILATTGSGKLPNMSFKITHTGYPAFYYNYDSDDSDESTVNTAVTTIFNTTVNTGKATHVAFVLADDGNTTTVSCYVDGKSIAVHSVSASQGGAKLEDASQLSYLVETPSSDAFVVGGNYSTANTGYFKGEIYSLAVYSNARTLDDIAADITAVDTEDADLMAYYDLTTVDGSTTKVVNGSANDTDNTYSLNIIETWMDTRRPALNEEDIAYSIALVGDTQIATEYDVYYEEDETKEKVVAGIYDWLLENKEEKNIEFVIGLGDIVQGESTYALNRDLTKDADAQEAEWIYAMEQIHTLDGEIPYSLIRGNHDSQAMYNKYVTQAGHGNVINGALDDTMLNTWQELVVGDIKYLIMSLDLGASDTELAWAEEVIKTHPNHNVIISTHAYLNDDGTTLDENDAYYPALYESAAYPNATHNRNNGDEMWDNYFSKYDNIVMIVSGHIGSDDVIMEPAIGDNGNTVAQMLIDPQSLDNTLVKAGDTPTGMICLLNFSADGKTVQVEQYSTANGQWYMSTSQMTFEMNVIKAANQKLNFNHAQLMTKDLPNAAGTAKRQFGYNFGACATTNAQVIVSAGYTNVISYCAPSDGLIKITDMTVGYHTSQQVTTTSRKVEFAVTDESGRILTNRGDILTLKTADAKYTYSGLAMETIEVQQGDCLYFVFHGVTGSANLITCHPNIALSTDEGQNWTTVSTSNQYYVVPWPANTNTYKSTNYEQGMDGFYYQYSTEYEKVDYKKPEYLYINPQDMGDYRTATDKTTGNKYVDFPFRYKNNECMTSYNQIIAGAGYTNVIAYEATENGTICIDEMKVWLHSTGTGESVRTVEFAVVNETGKILSNNGQIYTINSYDTYTNAKNAAENLIVSKQEVESGERIYFVFHGIKGSTNILRCNINILFSAENENAFTQVNTNSPHADMTLYASDNYVTDTSMETIDVASYQGKGNFYYQYSTENISNVEGIQVGDETEGIVTIYEAPVEDATYHDKCITEVASGGTVEYVDIDMLNVKKQCKINSEDGTLTDVRFIASVDNLSYQKAGFLFTKNETIAKDTELFVEGEIPDKANRDTTKVYTMLLANGIYRKASDIYADDSCNTTYAYVFEMTGIPANDGTIYVRAYVLLDDGTYVYGEPSAIVVTAAGKVN